MQETAPLASALLSALGFQRVGSNTVLSRLDCIEPDGSTVMRDSLLAGTLLILKLGQALTQIGEADRWNFVHILITDGMDTDSKATLAETAAAMLDVGRFISVARCRTVIIGIDLASNPEAVASLLLLRTFGLQNCEIHNIESVAISDLFERIQVDLGIVRRTEIGVIQSEAGVETLVVAQQDQAVLHLSRTSFAVVFNIDVSGSMAQNGRYERVKRSIAQFLTATPADDLVAGICFSDSVMSLAQMKIRQGRPYLGTKKPQVNSCCVVF